MAKRDESFNEFIKNFKEKNEQGWANIIDLTQEEQEARLLEKTPEHRKSEMTMLEEFRRRKNLKRYFELTASEKKADLESTFKKSNLFDMSDEAVTAGMRYKQSGPQRFFTPDHEECFNPSEFTVIFIDSDTVTNVTKLNRTQHRRVLLFIGNSRGLISYAMGKALDYQQAYENAFKTLRKNLILLPMSQINTSPIVLKGRHNDYRIKIYPQRHANYWGDPYLHKMLMITGFYHCRFSVKSRKRDPYAMIYAFVQAVSKNLSMDDISQFRGIKTHQTTFGNPSTNNSNKVDFFI